MEEFRGRLISELDTPEANLILSGEGVTELQKAEVTELREFLTARCNRIQILAYLREPMSFASSAFQQRIKGGSTRFFVPRPNYRRRFEGWLEVFGREAVTFVPFAPATYRNGSIITDFCDRVGINATLITEQRHNDSLSAEAVALLLQWNRKGMVSSGSKAHIKARRKLINLLQTQFPGKFVFDNALVATRIDETDLDWIEKQAGFVLPPPPPPAGTGAIGSAADLAQIGRAAKPRLQSVLRENGIAPKGMSNVTMLNALYRPLWESES